MAVPEYRVRLFLSVDLTGSTAFKHKNGSSLKWIKAFQEFYGQFPRMLSEQYEKSCGEHRQVSDVERRDGCPKLWKTVGDEILFTCKLFSQCHLGAAIDAFIETIKAFGAIAKNYELNTKGNAWVASFPTPNCSIKPIILNGEFAEDALNGKNAFPTEENEAEVDNKPSEFDFLGKGIDAGFRISKNSAIDTLTISPGLGILLAQAAGNHRVTGFTRKIHLKEMQIFKGVAGDSPYPVLTIDTSRDEEQQTLLDAQRELLGNPPPPANDKLEAYLKNYLEYHHIEIPKIKNTYGEQRFDPPHFYLEYREAWAREVEKMDIEDRGIKDAALAKDLENDPEKPVDELGAIIDKILSDPS